LGDTKKTKSRNVKGAIISLLKKTWVFALIGGIVALVGIFTPTATVYYEEVEVDVHIWLGGISYFTGESKLPGPGHKDVPAGLYAVGGDATGIVALVLITVSAAYLILYSLLTKKGKNFERLWAVYLSTGIVMVVAFTFWLIASSVAMTTILKVIGFGCFSPFIAGAFAIVAGIYERKGRE